MQGTEKAGKNQPKDANVKANVPRLDSALILGAKSSLWTLTFSGYLFNCWFIYSSLWSHLIAQRMEIKLVHIQFCKGDDHSAKSLAQ